MSDKTALTVVCGLLAIAAALNGFYIATGFLLGIMVFVHAFGEER